MAVWWRRIAQWTWVCWMGGLSSRAIGQRRGVQRSKKWEFGSGWMDLLCSWIGRRADRSIMKWPRLWRWGCLSISRVSNRERPRALGLPRCPGTRYPQIDTTNWEHTSQTQCRNPIRPNPFSSMHLGFSNLFSTKNCPGPTKSKCQRSATNTRVRQLIRKQENALFFPIESP